MVITLDDLRRLAVEAQNPPRHIDRLVQMCRNPHYEDFSDANEAYHPYYSFLYYLCREFQPLRCVELGTELGRATCFMAEGAPDSEIVTIDNSGRVPSTWGEHLASCDGITIVSGTDTIEWLLLQRIKRERMIDLLFIDSTHDVETTMAEYYTARPMIEPGGIILFDDANSSGPKKVLSEIAMPKIVFDDVNGPSLHGTNGFGCVLIP